MGKSILEKQGWFMCLTRHRSEAAFSITELMIACALTGIVMVYAVNTFNDYTKAQTNAEAAAAAENDLDSIEKLLKKRWAQRERPLSVTNDMPGEFTARYPGFTFGNAMAAYNCDSNRGAASFPGGFANTPACVAARDATTPAQVATFVNQRAVNILVGSITPDLGGGPRVRSAFWLRITNQMPNYPRLAGFNYVNPAVPANPCRNATPTAQSRVNQIRFEEAGRTIVFPSDPSSSIDRKTHSITACFSWDVNQTGSRRFFDDSTVNRGLQQDLRALNVELEAAYLGAGRQVKFLRKRVTLPVNSPEKSAESIRR